MRGDQPIDLVHAIRTIDIPCIIKIHSKPATICIDRSGCQAIGAIASLQLDPAERTICFVHSPLLFLIIGRVPGNPLFPQIGLMGCGSIMKKTARASPAPSGLIDFSSFPPEPSSHPPAIKKRRLNIPSRKGGCQRKGRSKVAGPRSNKAQSQTSSALWRLSTLDLGLGTLDSTSLEFVPLELRCPQVAHKGLLAIPSG